MLFWCLALLGTQQVKPVIGELVEGSLAEQAGLRSGLEIVAVDGQAVAGWGDVNLQLIQRVGKVATYIEAQSPGNSLASPYTIPLNRWLHGADAPNPIAELGIQPWRPQTRLWLRNWILKGLHSTLTYSDDTIVALDGQTVTDWQTVVNYVQARPGESVQLTVERAGQFIELPVLLSAQGNATQKRGYLAWGSAVVSGLRKCCAGSPWPIELFGQVQSALGP